jgi:hypothetical protein
MIERTKGEEMTRLDSQTKCLSTSDKFINGYTKGGGIKGKLGLGL